MASTVQEELNRANPNNLPDLARLAELGDGLAQISARTERVAVAANFATLSRPARAILRAWSRAGGTTGTLVPVAPETTPGAGQCAIDENGRIECAAADAVTSLEVTYIPLEGALIEETIPVSAAGVGTLNNARSAVLMVSAELFAPAAVPGAKTQRPRGTAVPAAGQFALQADGETVNFAGADCGADCTATVSYYAFPGVGAGTSDTFGERLEADFELGGQ